MRKFFRIIKRIFQISVLTLGTLYALVYIIISLPTVQNKMRAKGEKLLAETLEVPVEITRIEFSPFNRIELFDVTLPDVEGDTLLYAKKIGASIDVGTLIANGDIRLRNIQLFGLDVHITRPNPTSPTNLQFIIDAFKPKEKREPKPIDLAISTALIRRSKVRYDVLSEPQKEPGCFDANHIAAEDLTANLSIKVLDSDSLNAHIKRLSFKEQSGLQVDQLALRVEGNHNGATLSQFSLQLPQSQLSTRQATVKWGEMQKIEQFTDSAYITLDISDSQIILSDIAPLAPALRQFHSPINLACHIEGYVNDLHIENLSLDMEQGAAKFNTTATVSNLLCRDSMYINFNPIRIETSENGASIIGENLNIQDSQVQQILHNLGRVTFNSRLSGFLSELEAIATLNSNIGDIDADVSLGTNSTFSDIQCRAHIGTAGIDFASILGKQSPLGMVVFDIDLDGSVNNNKLRKAQVNGNINRIEYNNYNYTDITLNGKLLNNRYSGNIQLNDPNGLIDINAIMQLNGPKTLSDIQISCQEVDLAAFNLVPQSKGNKLSFKIDAQAEGNTPDNINGYVHINDVIYGNEEEELVWNSLLAEVQNDTFPQQVLIQSDYINGAIKGEYKTSTLLQTLTELIHPVVPSLIPAPKKRDKTTSYNNFEWYLNFKPNVQMAQMLKLPFTLTDTACIDGYVYDAQQQANLRIKAPNIWLGKTHMEQMSADVKQQDGTLDVAVQTDVINHLKEFSTTWCVNANAHNDQIGVGINWNSDTEATFRGDIKLDALLSPNKENNKKIDVAIDVLPTNVILNDTVWDIKPADISIKNKDIAVNRLEVSRPGQHIYIDGKLSENAGDTLHVDLQDVNVDYIFETLNIDYVTFGGNATGRVNVADIYSKTPHIATQNLDIREFSYNDAVFGNLSILGVFDLSDMSILLKGFITNKRGQESIVDGYIFPTQDSLSIAFDVDHIPLKFINPFVGQILTDIEGEASGDIVLEGNFARIYIYGDAYAYNFSFGVPFINTRYNLTDSVHFTQDQIRFSNITVYDEYGNKAKARGELNHKYFTQLEYDINIYDTDNMHVFNVPHTPGAMFYGNIFGSGDVAIKGNDYRTDIAVKMTTDRNSVFTYALTNTMSAMDYPFLSFTNKREPKKPVVESAISQIDSTVIVNNMIVLKAKKPTVPLNTLYLTLEANITPAADITLVMNEMTGDEMKANGEGVLRMEYNTATNEVMMFGSIEIERGSYNFSIEDIIRRNFTINSGSSVLFQGNPMNAQLDIDATYSLQANLADLDESFATDSELTRTTVPVNTKLLIQGDLMKPDIGFDIELPTLSADMESKMRSIVSTDEMMTRQIIYLLALNRFFTPEYNSGSQSNSNNELSAMTTSVLSSSLGSLMGQFSENWNISPNLRSEQGDFTDLEVDLYLSSQLLDNKLIFNGNIGYRDSRYSSTNFIGDFDIEYLLNESGTLRLKGYNHFNDRNYSMRTALTTQGIGLMYKHDFNSWSNFFEFYKRRKPAVEEEEEEYEYEYEEDNNLTLPVDTVITTVPDMLE